MMRPYNTSIGLLELDTEKELTAQQAEKAAQAMLISINENADEKRQAAEHDKED